MKWDETWPLCVRMTPGRGAGATPLRAPAQPQKCLLLCSASSRNIQRSRLTAAQCGAWPARVSRQSHLAGSSPRPDAHPAAWHTARGSVRAAAVYPCVALLELPACIGYLISPISKPSIQMRIKLFNTSSPWGTAVNYCRLSLHAESAFVFLVGSPARCDTKTPRRVCCKTNTRSINNTAISNNNCIVPLVQRSSECFVSHGQCLWSQSPAHWPTTDTLLQGEVKLLMHCKFQKCLQ